MGGLTLQFAGLPQYEEAHPGEAGEGVCESCAWAVDPTTGERFLLWCSNRAHWSLSRHDRRYGTDQRVEVAALVGHPHEEAA